MDPSKQELASTVLVRNATWLHEQEARDYMPDAEAVRAEYWWNLWTRRDPPYRDIADGSPIVLLNTWTERGGGGIFSWLVQARNVHTEQFPTKAEAIRAIARWAGVNQHDVRRNPYSMERPDTAGTVIYWEAEPVRRLDVLRSPGITVRPNGWLVTDAASLLRLGVNVSIGSDGSGVHTSSERSDVKDGPHGARHGQGRRPDEAVRRAIERHALDAAKEWCRKHGWTAVRNTSTTESWDLEGQVDGAVRYVEVKGTTGAPTDVEVTAGEVNAAKEHGDDHVLLLVHDIVVDLTDLEAPIASGGKLRAFDPWRPRDSELSGRRYTWKPASDRVTVS